MVPSMVGVAFGTDTFPTGVYAAAAVARTRQDSIDAAAMRRNFFMMIPHMQKLYYCHSDNNTDVIIVFSRRFVKDFSEDFTYFSRICAKQVCILLHGGALVKR